MQVKLITVVVLACVLSPIGSAYAADSHRVVVLDNAPLEQSPAMYSRILLLDIETNKILAQAEAGDGPDIGVSPKGDVIGVLNNHYVGDKYQPTSHLELYRTNDLSRVQSGLLPFIGRAQRLGPPRAPFIQFSPNGQEVIVQRSESYLNDEKPRRMTVDEVLLTCMRRELDAEGVFKLSYQSIRVPRCHSAVFLRTADWPVIRIWNPYLGAVEVADSRIGKIVSRLSLDDDPTLARVDPVALEKANIGALYYRLNQLRGWVLSASASDGRYAYYLPQQPSATQRYSVRDPGFLKKIDLSAEPPTIVKQSQEREPNLRAYVSAVSEPSHAIFVVREKMHPNGFTPESSRRVRVYSTVDLKFQSEIELSLASCDYLAASRDGKYMYALDRGQARLAVIEIATGREIKVLDQIGKRPVQLIALPEKAEEE